MDVSSSASLLERFKLLEDPRVEPTKQYKLIDIIAMAICRKVCSLDDWGAIQE